MSQEPEEKIHIVKMVADFCTAIYWREENYGISPVIRKINGELGVDFEGADFIPYSDLGYNSELGFYQISAFPEFENETLPYSAEGQIITLKEVVMTRGIEAALRRAGLEFPYIAQLVARYSRGDWGDTGNWREIEVTDKEIQSGAMATAEGGKLNLIGALTGINRILASYTTEELGRVWIITESDRSVTTILFPEEY